MWAVNFAEPTVIVIESEFFILDSGGDELDEDGIAADRSFEDGAAAEGDAAELQAASNVVAMRNKIFFISEAYTSLIFFAGTPATTVLAATSFVTTAPAATTAP